MQTSYDDQQIAHTGSLSDLELDHRLALTYPNWIVEVGEDHKVIRIYNPNGNNSGLGLFIKHAPTLLFNTCMGKRRKSSPPTSTKRDWIEESFIRELNNRKLEKGSYTIDSNLFFNEGLKLIEPGHEYV